MHTLPLKPATKVRLLFPEENQAQSSLNIFAVILVCKMWKCCGFKGKGELIFRAYFRK
jgi:hypothetical protein